MKVRLVVRRILASIAVPTGALLALLAYPDPAFAYAYRYGPYEIRSDRPIAPGMSRVLDDATRRLATSALLRPDDRFRIFVCNEPWRLALFARSTSVGGVADAVATRNIYLREIDADANRIVIPAAWGGLADAEDRPLSYFVAHEAAHILQSRRFGCLAVLRLPKWVTDGHADLVAKAGDFDLTANAELLRRGDRIVSEEYSRTGLYRRYHLMVSAALREGWTVERLFAEPPAEEHALRAARSL